MDTRTWRARCLELDRKNVIWGDISLRCSSSPNNAVLALSCCVAGSWTRFCSNISCIWPEQTKGIWQNKKAKQDILQQSYVHQVLIKSLYLYQKEGKGGVYMEIKMGEKSEWRKWRQAVLLLGVTPGKQHWPKPILEPNLVGGIEG